MTEIIRAPHSGFCFGVAKAVKTAYEALESEDSEVYICGELIHNKAVTDDLTAKGLIVIERPSEARRGGVLLIRSHGMPPEAYVEAKENALEIVDMTCVFVAKIHKIAEETKKSGKRLIIFGNAEHPEVVGINGWYGGDAIITGSVDEVERLINEKYRDGMNVESDCDEEFVLVAQTTSNADNFEKARQLLERNLKNVQTHNTICDATKKRQESCAELAKKCDLFLVIGDKSSSNTLKLLQISQKFAKKSIFLENKYDLPLQDYGIYNKIGVTAGASTPEPIIKEVISKMNENITETKEANFMDNHMEEIEKSLRLPRNGEIITGTVLEVTDRELIVNLGCKKDGIIPAHELTLEADQEITDLFKEGDEIQAKVLSHDDGDGNILLSKKKVEVNEHWGEITDAFENKTVIDVRIFKAVNGGVLASYKEVTGFIPLSQLSDKFVEDAAEFMGKELPVRVTKVEKAKGKATFSHKILLNEEKQKKIDAAWYKISESDIIEGTVMRFEDYGAFVDVGDIDGLLHISEISWGKLKHPQEVLTKGEKIMVKVLSTNREKGKISLGLKQTKPEPWSVIDEKYSVGQLVEGKVVQIKDYGAFVELEPGLDGLVHISEVAHKRIGNVAEEVSLGQVVQTKILDIDKDRRRISLSIKETIEPELFADEEPVLADDVSDAESPVVEDLAEAVEAPANEAVETPAEETLEAAPELEIAAEDTAATDIADVEEAAEAEAPEAEEAAEVEAPEAEVVEVPEVESDEENEA